jgi:maleylacetate reductase
VIVRWGLDALPAVLAELGVSDPLVVTSARWRDQVLPGTTRRFSGVQPHGEAEGVRAALEALDGADCLVALGGGSAIDTAKAVSAQTRLPVVSVPTTYSGAEWSPSFGTRDRHARTKTGGGGAHVAGIVYEPQLTLGLPASSTAGTALNALAHCAEGLYAAKRTDETDAHALQGAALISASLPAVLADPHDLQQRRRLLEGAMHAGAALLAGMGVGHAMAQALGGRYGLQHGTMNAVTLPHALRFNAEVAAGALTRLADAMGVEDAIARVDELAAMAGSLRLRDHGVPQEDLPELAEATAARPAAKGNPRPASAEEILAMLRAAW